MEQLLKLAPAAELLGVNSWWLIRRTRTSFCGPKIPFVRIGNSLRFRASDLEAYVKSLENLPAANSDAAREAKEATAVSTTPVARKRKTAEQR